MNALELIIDEHERFRTMLDRLDELDAGDHGSRRRLVDELIAGLVQHGAMEEQVLYPFVLSEIPDLEDAVREELEEHHVIELLMVELERLDPEHEQFDAKLEVFAEILLHHFEEEEEELFPALRERLDAATLEDLTDDLRSARESAPTEPDPDRVGG
jgi:hemerythrin-like domain-containing protein